MSKCDFDPLLKSHLGVGVPCKFGAYFTEHLFTRTPLEGYLWENICKFSGNNNNGVSFL